MSDRKTKIVIIGPDGGRDAGKNFLITEMSALKGERWGTRAAMAVSKSVPLSADLGSEGLAALAAIGFATFGALATKESFDLLDELLACVQVVPDPSKPDMVGAWLEESFSEPMTIAKLRLEAYNLHTNFFERAGPSISTIARLMILKLLSIKTSLEQSASLSQEGSQLSAS